MAVGIWLLKSQTHRWIIGYLSAWCDVFKSKTFYTLLVLRRPSAGRSNESHLDTPDQNEAVSPEYEAIAPHKGPSDGASPIYTELELTKQPTPSKMIIYANI